MWPSANRTFGDIACPEDVNCELPYCIFSHDASTAQFACVRKTVLAGTTDVEPPTKRMRLDDNGTPQPVKQDNETAKSQVFVGSLVSKQRSAFNHEEAQPTSEKPTTKGNADDLLPRSATRPVSPPPTKKSAAIASTGLEVNFPLMPRKVPQEPAGWARRLAMLKHLHGFMTPLNDKIKRALNPGIQALHMSANQLNQLAVNEEEKVARENGPVYENVLKQRFVALKNMSLEEWVKNRREATLKEKGVLPAPKRVPPRKIITGLTPKEEVIFLSTLTATEEVLAAHGVVTKVPTEAELQETQATQDSADFWERCDRCGTRFQVFPDRREEDGALTSGGKCQHHWGKKMFPKAAKGQPREPPRRLCCNEPLGSPGCVSLETHVFKLEDPKRMSLVMPFIETPENDKAEPCTAVCFDCEMGYTTHGLDLLRLTAAAWPSYKPLVDVLVRPLGHVLDLNTRFSGVTPEQFLNAKPYDPDNPKPKRNDLRVVTPQQARDLLLSYISPKTPLIGHSIENDLNVIRLVHPTIVDTVVLFPTRTGLPYRHGLKMLAKMHLDLDIQQGGAAGHDSYEDAKTTGELVRFKIAEQWKGMQSERWFVTDDGVHPPIPLGPAPVSAPPALPMIGFQGPNGEEGKRKRDEDEGDDEGKDAEEPPLRKLDMES